jgi:hypothetical protein
MFVEIKLSGEFNLQLVESTLLDPTIRCKWDQTISSIHITEDSDGFYTVSTVEN